MMTEKLERYTWLNHMNSLCSTTHNDCVLVAIQACKGVNYSSYPYESIIIEEQDYVNYSL